MSRGHIGAGTQRPRFVPGSDTSMRHLLHNGCTWVYIRFLSDLASAERERRCTQIRASPVQEPSGLPLDISRYSSAPQVFDGVHIVVYAPDLACGFAFSVRKRRYKP